MGRMGLETILTIRVPVTSSTMLNFEGTVMVTDTVSERVDRPLVLSVVFLSTVIYLWGSIQWIRSFTSHVTEVNEFGHDLFLLTLTS